MKQLILTTITLTFLLISYSNFKGIKIQQNSSFKIDTLNSIRIGNNWFTPKKSFELNSLTDSKSDTLILVTCAEYVYSPFGKISNKSELSSSNLKNFHSIDRIEKMENGDFEFQKLSLNSSHIILFFDNDPESSKSSYVFKGEIFDSQVRFDNNLKIGMNKMDFINTFFDYFPANLLNDYNTIVFKSCVVDITHIYTFKNDKLESVKFVSDSYWIVDYD
jgi:hypothetical protein